MVHNTPVLVRLMLLIDLIPLPAPTTPHRRGRPVVYPDRLFLKALVLMIVRHLPTVHALLAVLDESEMAPVRALLTGEGRYPARRTWERRLGALPTTLPAQIALLGTHLVGVLTPWASGGRAIAIDSTPLRARGGVWHRKNPRRRRGPAYVHRY